MNEEERPSRIQELASEFLSMQEYYIQAVKDKDAQKIQTIQDQRNRLLAEIRAIDPNYKIE